MILIKTSIEDGTNEIKEASKPLSRTQTQRKPQAKYQVK